MLVDGGQNLLDALRRNVGDFSVKYGCGQGTCGSCTVLVDAQPILACLLLAESVEGSSVETAAGLADGSGLHPLQKAFVEGFAAQCGYCTPGMLMAARALLLKRPNPTREDVVDAIAGNLCRCTGYSAIIEAVLSAAEALRRGEGRR